MRKIFLFITALVASTPLFAQVDVSFTVNGIKYQIISDAPTQVKVLQLMQQVQQIAPV